jgi:hypothetical protein
VEQALSPDLKEIKSGLVVTRPMVSQEGFSHSVA